MLCAFSANAQVSFEMRTGYGFNTRQPFISPSLNLKAGGIKLGADVVINTPKDAPVDLGVRLSYQYKFIEAGAGSYYQLYSTDAYDKFKNGWIAVPFVALHYKQFFVKYEYKQDNRFSAGISIDL